MFAAGLADPGGVPVSAAQRAQRAQVERVSTAIEERCADPAAAHGFSPLPLLRLVASSRLSPRATRARATHMPAALLDASPLDSRLDELAVKAAVLSQQGRHSEAVLFLREGKASTSRSYLAISPHISPCLPIGKALYLEQQRRFPDGFCTACVHLRPPRTHHCRITDRCVARYDHYCCYIGNSVGHNNYRWFFGFVWATALHAALILTASASRLLLLAASLLAHHDPHHGPARPHAHRRAAATCLPCPLPPSHFSPSRLASHEAAAAYYGDASPPPPPPLPRPSALVFGRAALEAACTCPVAMLLCLYCAAVSALLVGFGSFHAHLAPRSLAASRQAGSSPPRSSH